MYSWVWASTPAVTRIITPVRAPELAGDVGEALDLVEGVDDDPADTELDGALELAQALVVAVEADALHREARPLGDEQLAARADVEVQPLLGQPAHDGRAEEGLAGVEDVVAANASLKARARARKSASSRTYAGEPCSRDQVGQRDSADAEHAVGLGGGLRPEQLGTSSLGSLGSRSQAGPRRAPSACAQPDGCEVGTRHIRSGAETPSRRRPLASTVRVATTSISRARLTGADRLVALRQHPAGVVEPVVDAGGVLEVAGDPVRLAQLGRGRDDARELGERPQQLALLLVRRAASGCDSRAAPSPRSAALRIRPAGAGVGVLHVVDRVVVGGLRPQVEVDVDGDVGRGSAPGRSGCASTPIASDEVVDA